MKVEVELPQSPFKKGDVVRFLYNTGRNPAKIIGRLVGFYAHVDVSFSWAHGQWINLFHHEYEVITQLGSVKSNGEEIRPGTRICLNHKDPNGECAIFDQLMELVNYTGHIYEENELINDDSWQPRMNPEYEWATK